MAKRKTSKSTTKRKKTSELQEPKPPKDWADPHQVEFDHMIVQIPPWELIKRSIEFNAKLMREARRSQK